MSQSPRRMLLPALGKRKRKGKEASGSTIRNTSKPSSPVPTATTKGHKPKSSNLLLAGYLANEFLTNGTLFGRKLESAKARPGPFCYSSYSAEPKRGTKLLQQTKGNLDSAQARPGFFGNSSSSAELKGETKLLQQAKGNLDSARARPGFFGNSSSSAEPRRETKLLQIAKGDLDSARARPGPFDNSSSSAELQQAKQKLDWTEAKAGPIAKSSAEPKRRKPVQQHPEASLRNLDQHYSEVTELFKTNEVHIEGSVNPKQLYQWIKRW